LHQLAVRRLGNFDAAAAGCDPVFKDDISKGLAGFLKGLPVNGSLTWT
jgi:hypothetical protein